MPAQARDGEDGGDDAGATRDVVPDKADAAIKVEAALNSSSSSALSTPSQSLSLPPLVEASGDGGIRGEALRGAEWRPAAVGRTEGERA